MSIISNTQEILGIQNNYYFIIINIFFILYQEITKKKLIMCDANPKTKNPKSRLNTNQIKVKSNMVTLDLVITGKKNHGYYMKTLTH